MRRGRRLRAATILLVCGMATGSCGGGGGEQGESNDTPPPVAAGGLTAAQLENGIGPITTLSLGAVDEELAEQGEAVFRLKCAACHKLTERYVGPTLGDVLDRRRPEYVMNMILNPAEMLEKHPEAKALLAQFLTPMPNQQLTQEEARAVLEYLREAATTGSH